jgi:PilZ domain
VFKRADRRRIFKSGVIEFGVNAPTAVACSVRNISASGACLQPTSPMWFPDQFTLRIESESVRKPCKVVWRKERRVGVAFVD